MMEVRCQDTTIISQATLVDLIFTNNINNFPLPDLLVEEAFETSKTCLNHFQKNIGGK